MSVSVFCYYNVGDAVIIGKTQQLRKITVKVNENNFLSSFLISVIYCQKRNPQTHHGGIGPANVTSCAVNRCIAVSKSGGGPATQLPGLAGLYGSAPPCPAGTAAAAKTP